MTPHRLNEISGEDGPYRAFTWDVELKAARRLVVQNRDGEQGLVSGAHETERSGPGNDVEVFINSPSVPRTSAIRTSVG